MDDTSLAPTCARWQALLAKMQEEKTPMTLKQLAVNGNDLLAMEIPPQKLASTLHALLAHVAVNPKDNEKVRLCKLALSFQNK